MSAWFNLRNGLIALALALAAALGIETDWGASLGASPTTARQSGARHDVASVLPDFRLGSEAGAYAQISERPLLNPSRRPAPTQAVAAAPEPPKPQVRRGLYQLVGVTDLGTVKIAQLREIASNRVKSVREGDALQEMTVKKIETNQVTLAFQGETDIVELAKYTASGRVPTPPAPPPPVVAQAQPAPAPMPTPVPAAPVPPPSAPVSAIGQTAAVGQRTFANGLVAVDPPPGAQQREVINVVDLLERRRQARQQAGGGQ